MKLEHHNRGNGVTSGTGNFGFPGLIKGACNKCFGKKIIVTSQMCHSRKKHQQTALGPGLLESSTLLHSITITIVSAQTMCAMRPSTTCSTLAFSLPTHTQTVSSPITEGSQRHVPSLAMPPFIGVLDIHIERVREEGYVSL